MATINAIGSANPIQASFGGTGDSTILAHAVLIGEGTGNIASAGPGTTGQVLTGVTGSDPTWQSPAASSISITGNSGGALTGNAFTFTGGTSGLTFAGAGSTETLGGTLVVSNGGTGQTTLTAHGVLLGNGTTAITQLAAAATGSTLMGSTGADPSFTGSPSFSGSVTAGTTITATSGNVIITSGNLVLPDTSSSTIGGITLDAASFIHTYPGIAGGYGSLFVGNLAGNFTATPYLGLNTGIGSSVLQAYTTGDANTGIGNSALSRTTTGAYNVAIGYSAGAAYASSESSNICIGTNAVGTISESNVLRIGNGTGTSTGNLNKAFICGITGITVTGTAVLVSASNQLGIAVSSRKYKDNIEDMGDESDRLYKLRPVKFTLKEYQDKSKQFGLIAEEVYEVMPEIVVLDKEGLPQSVQYHNLPALLLNEIQKLNKRIIALESR